MFQCLTFQVPSRQDRQRQLGQPRLPEDHHGARLRRKTGRCGSEVRQPSVELKGRWWITLVVQGKQVWDT